MKRLPKKLLVPVVTVMLTLAGNYGVNQLIQAKGKAVLSKDVIKTDLSSLPTQVQQQIPLIPITYSLQHRAGGPAQKVTIFVKSDTLLSIADLKFSMESEDRQISSPDLHTIKVDVPTIRPDGLVSFQIITTPSNQIKFSELSENARITTLKGVEVEKRKTLFVEYCLSAVGILLWLTIVVTVGFTIWRARKWWQGMETGIAPPKLKERLIILIIILLVYDSVLSSFGPFGGFIPVPRISFNDLTAAFLFYLLVTRYRLIENWILAATNKQKAANEQSFSNVKEEPEEIESEPIHQLTTEIK
jgi:hypothetical protein